MTNSAFDAKRSQGYDDRIDAMIPCYTPMQQLTEVFLGTELPENARLLVVGAGTGAEVLECGSHHAGWQITAVEPSKEMVAQGKAKSDAAGLGERVNWQTLALDQMEESDPFDGATLLLVLHFLNEEEKLNLLCEISDRLKPGAPFAVSTFVGDPTNTRTKKIYDLAKAHALAKGLPAAEVTDKFDLTRKDIFLEPEEKIKMHLRDAGFIDVQRIAQGLAMHLWTARKQR